MLTLVLFFCFSLLKSWSTLLPVLLRVCVHVEEIFFGKGEAGLVGFKTLIGRSKHLKLGLIATFLHVWMIYLSKLEIYAF